MDESNTTLSRRNYTAATGGLIAAGLAGCMGVLSDDDQTQSDAAEYQLQVEIEGEGPSEPVTVIVQANDEEADWVVDSGDELEESLFDLEHPIEVEVENGEELDIDVEWELPSVDLELEFEQDNWRKTSGGLSVVIEDGELNAEAEADLELQNSTTDMVASDTRPVHEDGEFEYEVDVDVEENEIELEFEVDWDEDTDDDDVDNVDEDQGEDDD